MDVFEIVENDMPIYQGGIFDSKSNDKDISIDEGRGLVFLTGGGTYGINVWNLQTGTQVFWPYDDAYGRAVTQIPSLPFVFGASGSDVIRQFHKSSGKTIHSFTHTDIAAGLFPGDVVDTRLEMAANGIVVYGKEGNSDDHLGVIGLSSLAVPRSAPTRPANLTATRGAYFDRIILDWYPVPGATSYQIFRGSSYYLIPYSNPIATVNGSTNSYSDFGVDNEQVYKYWVKAVNAYGGSQYSQGASGHIPNGDVPDVPENVVATNGVYSDLVKVSWDYAERAMTYTVYRNTIDDVASATLVASNLLSEVWSDTTVSPDVLYYYWVRANNRTGNTAASDSDFGFAASIDPPHAPSGLSATDSLYPDKVSLVWNGTLDTDSYSVFRNTSDTTTGATEITSGLSVTSFEDTSVIPDVIYYYWVVAVNNGGASPFSASDAGNAINPPQAPASITATDGTFGDKVEVSWNSVPAADSYTLYRSTANNPNGASQIAMDLSVTSFSDLGVVANTAYFYWVKALNTGGDSPFSQGDRGHAGTLPPTVPGGVNASDGTHPDRIAVSWGAVGGADSYTIYRSTSNSSGSAQAVASDLGATSWEDTSYVKGVIYYYWVEAVNSAGSSGLGSSNSGFVIQYADTPTGLSASDALHESHVRLSWSAANHAERYYIYRATEGGFPVTVSHVSSATTSFSDYGAGMGTEYEYYVTAWTATGGHSSPSAIDLGSRKLASPTNLVATDGYYQGEVRLTWSGVNGSALYNIFRGVLADGSDKEQIGTTSGGSYIDSGGTPGENYYYFVSSQNGSNVSEASAGEQGYGTVGEPFRPDGMIGKSLSQKKGDDIYVIGKAQEYRLVSKRLKRMRWYLGVENDGETEDTFSSLLTRRNGFFNAQIFDVGTSENVTASANVGTLSFTLQGGESQSYRLDVKPSRKARNKRKRKVFSFTVQSANRLDLMDGVRARAETKK